MSREQFAYRDNLAAILEYSGGRHLLSVNEVMLYCDGKVHTNRTAIKRRFPFKDNRISAETLARCLAGGVGENSLL